jgi:hypothetical protein
MCAAAGCERRIYARGHCGRHYKQLLRRGEVQPDRAPRACAVEGCGRRAVTRGWCHGHYVRWSRTGDERADVPLSRPVATTCSIDACQRPMHGHDLCRTHLARVSSYGHAAAAVPVRSPGDEGWLTHGYRGVVVPEELRHLTGGAPHVLEHRLVMAVLLDRPLAPGESVHHKNGDRLDNRPANLELWSRRQPSGQRVADKLAFAYELLALYDPEAWAAVRAGRDAASRPL